MRRIQMLGLVIFIMANNWINAHPINTIVDSGDVLAITIAFIIQMIGLAIVFFSDND